MVLGWGGTRLSLGRFMHTEMGDGGQREKVPRDPCKKKHRRRKTQSLYGEHGIVFFSCNAAAQYHRVSFFLLSGHSLPPVRPTFSYKYTGNPNIVT